MKVFNTTANCVPEENYMVDISERLKEIKKMVDEKKYFTINRARQYGKTTTLKALANYLQDEYCVLSLDFQKISKASYRTEEAFIKTFSRIVLQKKKQTDMPSDIAAQLKDYANRKEDEALLDELFSTLTEWCEISAKPIVLLIDEVDTAANNQVFLDFLAQLRASYIERRDDPSVGAFQSVILAGVTDVKHLKAKIRPDEDHKENSPWNIAADFNIDMSLSADGIKGMLDEYEADHHTGMNTETVAAYIEKYTSGYPYLVSRICELIDTMLVPAKFASLSEAWTEEGVDETIKLLLADGNNPLFGSVMSKLENYPTLKPQLRRILMQGDTISWNPYDKEQAQLRMYGFIKNKNNTVAIANRIFEMLLYQYFLGETTKNDALRQDALRNKSLFINDDHTLNMPLILDHFVKTQRQIHKGEEEHFLENEGRERFLTYIAPIVEGQSENLTASDIYYGANLQEYGPSAAGGVTNWYYGTVNDGNTAVYELKAPDHYIFGGWYEDQSCTVPFNFNGTMPAANKIVYAQWTPERFQIRINPNGGEIDHVNHGGYAGYGLSINTSYEQYVLGYNTSQATYFNNNYGEPVAEYSIRRRFVAMSDAVAEEYEAAGYTVYYYMNYQWRSTDSTAGNDADLRSALYLTEQEVRDFYDLYQALTTRRKNLDPVRYQDLRVLNYDTWRSLYVSSQKYRPLNTNESWTFLGWYKDGESMPYNFADPVSGSFRLTAHWRLDGGYSVQYIPQYTMPDGSEINGEMDSWRDPVESYLTYADNAATHIFKAPTGLTKDGIAIADDSVIFLGWALVSKTGTDEHPVYTPLEVDAEGNIDCYYNPGDPYTVSAVNAGTNSTVYMQAVYQYREASDRRPKVANLTLDANTGYVDSSTDLPVWDAYPGVTAINTEDHLLNVDGNNEPTQIEFGDIQSSAAVHLYQYATDAGVIASDGHNYFIHPNKYLLLGFDDEPTEGDYIATYAADSVIGVTREDEKTIYAVWEPMVYMTFVNDTGNTVSFGLSAPDHSALTVINVKDGLYDRTALADYGEITLEAGESIQLAFPNGAEKQITVSGTNVLGTGRVFVWNSSLDLEENGETTSYDTLVTGNDITYSHNASSLDTHTLPTGFVNNTQAFTFNETLITNKNPIIVTFTERSNAYALVLDDNYPGGGKQEYDYSAEDIAPENGVAKTQVLPSTSTRIGYQFLGWATEPNASSADYSASLPSGSPWTITDLNAEDGFFSHDTTTLESGTVARTLYAVWESKADAGIVYIYKEVPAPGNQDQDFTFTVKITGSHHVGDKRETIDESHSFILHHGWYLKISSSNENGTSATPAYVQSVVQVFDDHGVQQESDATIRWQRDVTVSDRNGFDGNLQITVSESQVTHYTSSITRNAHTYNGAGNPLYIGNSSDITTLPLTLEAEEVYWKNTDAGGTAVFTNQRQTYDITVSKTLVSNNNASRAFSYSAVYTDTYTSNDDQMTAIKELDGFVVTSGSETILSDIPAGVTLTIRETEDPDNNYVITATSHEGATDEDTSDNGFAFSVTKDDTITYTNTLKSYPVTFRLVDQDGNPLQAMFSLSSTSGSLGTDLYAESDGVFYTSNTFWADTYTLNQTTTHEGYISIQGTPVTLTVTGNGITSNHSWVTVEEDENGGYIVTVKNWAQENITVNKVLIDPLLSSTRIFGFGYSYISPVDNNSVSGTFTISPMANSTTGASHILTVPANAENLMITELTSDSYAAVPDIYTTISEAYATDGSVIPDVEGDESVYSFHMTQVSDDATIRFTNSRKTQTVTVRKEVSDPDDISSFTFTGTLLNGAHPIPNYIVYTDGTDSSNDLETDASGNVSFELQHGESKPLTIPYGAKLVIEETLVSGYVVNISSNEYTDGDDEDNLFTIASVETDGTVLFTNVKGARLTIQKNVSGAIGDQSRPFTFILTSVEDERSGATYSWVKGDESGTLTTAEGHNTFTLTHGESIVIILPFNKEVEITEENDIYTTTWTLGNEELGNEEGTTGNHKKMTLTENCDLLVDNHLDPVAPTNYQTNIVPYLLMLAAGALLLLLRKKRAEEKGGGSFE